MSDPIRPSSFFATRRRLLAAGASLGLAALPAAGARAEDFEPQLGRVGKDVMWLPTPDEMIARLLTMAGAGPEDRLVDLGSGDGRFVIAAARDFGTPSRGIEFDPKMVDYATRMAADEGMEDKVSFEQGDVFEADFSEATIVAIYLLPTLNLRLRPKLLAMRPGTRIVTHAFNMGEWEPDERTEVAGRDGHLWTIPANAGGIWRLSVEGDEAAAVTLELEQTFQRVRGMAQFGEVRTSLRAANLTGTHIALAYTDAAGALQTLNATIEGDEMRGSLRGPQGERPVSARREGPAPDIGGSGQASEEEMRAAAAFLGEW